LALIIVRLYTARQVDGLRAFKWPDPQVERLACVRAAVKREAGPSSGVMSRFGAALRISW
jgi:hypothetical protein